MLTHKPNPTKEPYVFEGLCIFSSAGSSSPNNGTAEEKEEESALLTFKALTSGSDPLDIFFQPALTDEKQWKYELIDERSVRTIENLCQVTYTYLFTISRREELILDGFSHKFGEHELCIRHIQLQILYLRGHVVETALHVEVAHQVYLVSSVRSRVYRTLCQDVSKVITFFLASSVFLSKASRSACLIIWL
jgi:hypothetical protein